MTTIETEAFLQTFLVTSSILIVGGIAYFLRKIDLWGWITGTILALTLYWISGPISLLALFVFFVLGTFASAFKKQEKSQFKLDQENDGRRTISNVLGNGGAAGLFCASILIFPKHAHIANGMILASFATACSDTFSSEFGNIYGRKYFNILSMKHSKRGLDGTVSWEGIIAGIFGSAFIATIPIILTHSIRYGLIVFVCGMLGNLMDSVLGATLQQQKLLNNHQVNFYSTLLGGMFFFPLQVLH